MLLETSLKPDAEMLPWESVDASKLDQGCCRSGRYGFLMLPGRGAVGNEGAARNRHNAPKMLGFGLATGVFSGFFGIGIGIGIGIGGGFLIVPGLVASTEMPILNAIGWSLVAVTAIGLTAAFNYSLSGLVNEPLVFVFIAGGSMGSLIRTRL